MGVGQNASFFAIMFICVFLHSKHIFINSKTVLSTFKNFLFCADWTPIRQHASDVWGSPIILVSSLTDYKKKYVGIS